MHTSLCSPADSYNRRLNLASERRRVLSHPIPRSARAREARRGEARVKNT